MDQQAEISNKFNLQSFSSDVLIYSFGQVVLLIFGLIQSLIIPKYLSTTDYGYWQIFLLYTTYVGILHFGFLDGIFVRWAGKNLEVLREEIPIAFRFICLEQVILVGSIMMILEIIDIPSKEISLAVLFNAIFSNLLAYFLFIAQATKRFKLVTAANIGKGLIFLISVILLFFCGYFSYFSLILATIITESIIIILFAVDTRKYLFCHPTCGTSLFKYGKENIGMGIFVLLGNFIAVIFATIDRFTVSSFFSITQFAIYTFAVTMCSLATVFLQAVAQVFFPYLAGSNNETRTRAYSLLKPFLVIFWAGIIATYFPLSALIKYYLPNYYYSLPLLAILLCRMGFSGPISILHANFFKVYRKQRAYFVLGGLSLLEAGVLYIISAYFIGTLRAVAATAVVSFGLWYILNEVVLIRFVEGSIKEIVKWVLVIGAYIGAFLGIYTISETWITGFCFYSVMFAGITTICLHKEIEQIYLIINEVLKRKKN